ncbi:MAG: aspartyl-tRNA synthetase [Parcubacteria group bacterium Gr01-1014_70]|nr:MAG: aspartyl-tRNA synthetase [Parcubacteria group bacterium Gr01-1014_70]
MNRTYSADIPKHDNQQVTLMGWIDVRRDHGKLLFVDVRDRTGIAQIVFVAGEKELYKKADQLRPEWVVQITGLVQKRPEGMRNAHIPTGDWEVHASELQVLNEAQTIPFDIAGDGYDIGEENRMKFRYLDLRRPRMQRNMRLRQAAAQFIREYLIARGFTEINTPILTKTTPEGARDFLVPSRLHKGNFYALPQSPQQYKQLLMVAGFERYFQFPYCFRDEDSRKDRAFGEFVQLDIEMSFVTQEDILQLTESLFTELVENIFPEKHSMQKPWPRLSHKEAVAAYGTDKPDLRKNKNDPHELAFAWVLDFPLFTEQSDADFFHGSGNAKFAPSHHMFTAPHPDDIALLDTNPEKVRGLQHDMVLNGFEVGGGSMRIHQPEIQEKIFKLIGFSDEQKEQFAHLLTAFTYGVPPHGGIAPGFDRFLYVLLGEPSLREVIAFPKTGDGRDLMMDAPSAASKEQLEELGIIVRQKD